MQRVVIPHTQYMQSGKITLQEVRREQVEEQRRAAAAARQELKEEKKGKQAAPGPAPSMALRTQASLQQALSNDDDGMFWDYGPAAGLRAGAEPCCVVLCCAVPCCAKLCRAVPLLCHCLSCCAVLCRAVLCFCQTLSVCQLAPGPYLHLSLSTWTC